MFGDIQGEGEPGLKEDSSFSGLDHWVMHGDSNPWDRKHWLK